MPAAQRRAGSPVRAETVPAASARVRAGTGHASLDEITASQRATRARITPLGQGGKRHHAGRVSGEVIVNAHQFDNGVMEANGCFVVVRRDEPHDTRPRDAI